MQSNSYEENYQILQELEAKAATEGLCNCFGLAPNGQVIYFDAVGGPHSVEVRGMALLRGNLLNLGTMPIQTISTKEAYQHLADQRQAGFLQSQAYERAKKIRWNRSSKRRRLLWLGAGMALVALTFGLALWLDPQGASQRVSQAEQTLIDFYADNGVHINGYQDVPVVVNPGGYNPLGPVSISRATFKAFLQEMNSPALPEADNMYSACVQNNCDPAVLVAFFEHESSGGRQGVAAITKSIGNIRCTTGYTCYTTDGNGSFRQYASWTEGAKDWVQLLTMYKNDWKLLTLEEIIPHYAPQADHNDEASYIAAVKGRVDDLRGREAKIQSSQPVTQANNDPSSDIPVGNPVYEDDWVITQGFSARHPEIDIARPANVALGTSIHTTIGGVVTVVRNDPLFGNRVFVSNGVFTVHFNHLTEAIPVASGQTVRRGDVIGLMGSTGKSTGPHLDYEIFQGQARLNPMDWVTRRGN
jgi:hypothetical protein